MINRHTSFGAAVLMGVALLAGPGRLASTVQAADQGANASAKPVPPIVFQAAGPTIASIQSMVDAFRAALGGVNNGNVAGPLVEGRREINWDGGGSTATSLVPTPFDGFLVSRGGRFTTPGSGFVQAPVEGLVDVFRNKRYDTAFHAFSPVRLFSPIDGFVTNARFFVPGGGLLPATTRGFGVVFSDVDLVAGRRGDQDIAGSSMTFFDAKGRRIAHVAVPASKGDASVSFLGVLFDGPRVASVRISAGNVAPGANDSSRRDVVMMDDFIYGEPQPIQDIEALVDLQERSDD